MAGVSTVPRSLLLSTFLTVVPVTIGVAVAADPVAPAEVAPYVATPLADFDSSTAVVRRAEFCDVVPAEAARDALGEDAVGAAYGNGDASDLVPGGDVAHEYGCRFIPGDSTTGTEARAWVFAPPVTASRAEALATDAARTRGCAAQDTAPAFGTPTLALLCSDQDTRTASFRGLFGDAWLTCSLTLPTSVPADELAERAGQWCVAVAVAASV